MGGDAQLFAPLERPPTALSLTVRKLIGRVLDGSIRVPTFQRPLRWQSRDVLRLLDSVLKGYPIDSLLFWKQSFPAVEDLQLGRIDVNHSCRLATTMLAGGRQAHRVQVT